MKEDKVDFGQFFFTIFEILSFLSIFLELIQSQNYNEEENDIWGMYYKYVMIIVWQL